MTIRRPAAGLMKPDVLNTPVDTTFRFPCPYCRLQMEVPRQLCECIVVCSHCGRSLLAPASDLAGQLDQPVAVANLYVRSRSMRAVLVTCGTLVGAGIGSLTLLIPMWFYALSIIGLGVRHIGAAGLLGGALGAFVGGLLAYRATMD